MGTLSLLLITGAAGRTASGGFLGGLIAGTAGRSRSGCLRLFVPAKEIRKSHNCYLQNVFSELFAPLCLLFYSDF